MPNPHNRYSIRLKGYDYSQPGAYFITLCVDQRQPVFEDKTLQAIVTGVWQALPRWFPSIRLDEFVIMPNHIHFIVWLCYNPSHASAGAGVGATLAVAPVSDAVAPVGSAITSVGGANDTNGEEIPIDARTATDGAGASPAPTTIVPTATGVGATLAVAPVSDAVTSVFDANTPVGDANDTNGEEFSIDARATTDGAGASPAPTTIVPTATGVGATLAVAPVDDAVAPVDGAVTSVFDANTPAGDANDKNGEETPIDARAATTGAGASPAPTSFNKIEPWTIPSPTHSIMNPTVGEIVAAFKSIIFKVYLGWIKANGLDRRAQFWQRNYYEHVIKNEDELTQIRNYIVCNPDNWQKDSENPDHNPPLECK